jgi:hypothetical protein
MDSNHEVYQVRSCRANARTHFGAYLGGLSGLCNTRSTWLVEPGEHLVTMEWVAFAGAQTLASTGRQAVFTTSCRHPSHIYSEPHTSLEPGRIAKTPETDRPIYQQSPIFTRHRIAEAIRSTRRANFPSAADDVHPVPPRPRPRSSRDLRIRPCPTKRKKTSSWGLWVPGPAVLVEAKETGFSDGRPPVGQRRMPLQSR